MKGGDRARSPPSSFPARAAVILLPFPLVLERRTVTGPLGYMEPKNPLGAPPLAAERVRG